MELEKIAAEEREAVLEHIKVVHLFISSLTNVLILAHVVQPEVLTLLSSWKEPSPGHPSDLGIQTLMHID